MRPSRRFRVNAEPMKGLPAPLTPAQARRIMVASQASGPDAGRDPDHDHDLFCGVGTTQDGLVPVSPGLEVLP